MPATSIIKFISRMTENCVSKLPLAHSRNRSGTCSSVRIQPATVEHMISSSTTPVATPAV